MILAWPLTVSRGTMFVSYDRMKTMQDSVTQAPTATTVLEDLTIPPNGHWGRRLAAGDHLRLVDIEGQQAVDFLCYDADRPEIRYNAADTMKLHGSIYLTKGARIMSDMGYPLMTLLEDSCGYHDTLAGCCSKEINKIRYGVDDTPNCRDNFLSALAEFSLGKKDIVANINFFMYVPVQASGDVTIAEGVSKPGDHVDLRADTDVIAVLSNCPQENNPCSGLKPTAIQVTVYRP